MKSNLINKKNIFSLIIILLPFLYIIKKILDMPLSGLKLVDVLFIIALIVLIISIIINIWLRLFKKRKFSSLIFVNLISVFIFLCVCSIMTFGNFNLYTLFGLSRNFNNVEYENKIEHFENIEEKYIAEDVPTNISNIVLYSETSESIHENSIAVYLCSDDKCIYKNEIMFFDSQENITIYKIPNGYDIDRVIFENLDEEKNYLVKIEYNNEEVSKSMNSIDSKFIIIGVIVTIIVISLLYIIKKRFLETFFEKLENNLTFKNLKLENCFFIIAIVIGVAFSILLPIYNIPDEPAHLQMIYEDIGLNHIYEDINENYYCETCSLTVYNTTKPIDISEYQESSKIKLDDYSFDGFRPSLAMIRHLPQTIGVLIGQLLHLPIFWILFLGEFFGVLVYAIGGYFVIKRIPVKKSIMFFIMLIPMAIQQYSSLSYDSFLNICMFLCFTEFIKVKFTDEKIDFSFIFKILVLLFIIALCKLPYVLISLLFFIIPLDKYYLKYKKINIDVKKLISNKFIVLSIVVITIIAMILVLPKIEYGRLLIASILEPIRFIYLLFVTIKELSAFYIVTAIASFGWLNTTVSKMFILFVLGYGAFITFFTRDKETKENTFTIKDQIILALTFLSITLLLFVVMTTWTYNINGIEVGTTITELRRGLYLIENGIEGVQGRYFICLLPLILFIPKRFKISISDWAYNLINILFYIISFVYCIYILIFRFWI